MTENTSVQPHQVAAPVASRGGLNWLKWTLGCAGIGMLLLSGLVMAFLIVMPVIFRGLLPEQQYEILKHAPFMAAFVPTREYAPDTLPTVQIANNQAALALLNAPSATSSPTVTTAPTATPHAAVVSVLASVTPTSPNIATPTFEPTGTPFPTVTPFPTDTPTLVPSATQPDIPVSYHVPPNSIKRVDQGWNDCGPANITQALGYYGWTGTQDDAIKVLKPNSEDRNVSPWQMVGFVNEHTGVRAISRIAGDLTLIKLLISQRFAVIMETGYIVAGEGWAGHYLTVLGYDDGQHIVYGGDSNLGFGADGLGQHEDYTDLDTRWREFNREYIVLYPKERESELAALLGQDADPTYNAQHALQVAQDEAKAMPDNPFTWFNLGSSLVMLGRYQEATVAFDQSRNTGDQLPFRMLWYQFTPYEAYYNAGRYDDVLQLVQATLGTTTFVEESWYWRGMVEAVKNQNDAAVKDFKSVVDFNPGSTDAADAMARVRAGTFQPPSAGVYAHTQPSS